jgi:predicted DNA-binding transcriptional regulator YafY
MFSNKQIVQIEKGMAERACAEFEQAIKTQKKVKLILKTKKIIECVPIDILEKDGKLYFHVIYDKKEKNIASNRISGIEISQEKFADLKFDNTVIYKLTGDLAKNYNLRENERILNNNLPDSETIIIYNENIPMLISRLLRYGELCEIINPEKTRSKIKDIINETLANYGE